MKNNIRRMVAVASLTLASLALTNSIAHAESSTQVLRIVPQVNLTVLDPIFSSAYVTRNHGYMIYDTLFGVDDKGNIKPQMVDRWNTSADHKTWTFTLRPGLAFHDGAPVTSDDVIASLKRWSSRDALGGLLAQALDRYEAVDASTFRIHLKEPFGLVLEALGKPSSPVPFIMPARIAATPGTEQIKEHIGSGPYMFKPDEFKPGEKVVYVKNDKYKPRKEPASGTAGGKVVNVDRVEWLIIRDANAQLNSLTVGEVDILEQPPAELYEPLRTVKDVRLFDMVPTGYQYTLRMNFLLPPFDNVLVRRAAMLAMGQDAVLRTQIRSQDLFKFCKSLYPCGTPYESNNTGIFTGAPDPKAARKLLEEAGYKGEPVVLMRPTDFPTLTKAPLVVKQQLEQAGFKVDVQNMDWQTLVARRAKKDAPSAGGWNAFITYNAAVDNMFPVTMLMMNATGDKGWFGWQNDPALEELKTKFARALTPADKKKAAEAAQLRAVDQVTHVNLGQFFLPAAVRSNVQGLLTAGAQVYWNVSKTK
jgi:peptide/nickel transport system substrate-binding protein